MATRAHAHTYTDGRTPSPGIQNPRRLHFSFAGEKGGLGPCRGPRRWEPPEASGTAAARSLADCPGSIPPATRDLPGIRVHPSCGPDFRSDHRAGWFLSLGDGGAAIYTRPVASRRGSGPLAHRRRLFSERGAAPGARRAGRRRDRRGGCRAPPAAAISGAAGPARANGGGGGGTAWSGAGGRRARVPQAGAAAPRQSRLRCFFKKKLSSRLLKMLKQNLDNF